jgi:hypothetical protein
MRASVLDCEVGSDVARWRVWFRYHFWRRSLFADLAEFSRQSQNLVFGRLLLVAFRSEGGAPTRSQPVLGTCAAT